MGDCPERSRTVALGSGALRSEDVAAARSHAEQCDSCRVVLSEVGTAPTMRVDLDAPSGRTQATMTAPEHPSAPTADRTSRPWIGRYRVISKLGAGGMGTVYAAEDRELDRRVAIKLLHGTSETASARLVREARALAKLRHPNVVTIYEVGRDEGDAFVAMELVEGTTLRSWLQGEHSIEQSLAVLIQAGHGLAAAHAEGLIHRDFKPENVMVGKDGRVQVLDFGLAKTARAAVDEDDEPSRPSDEAIDAITQTGTLLGTPAYMAPEQLVGEATDARTDQFAYCVTLFEVLHGFRPFGGATHAALHAAIIDGTFVGLPRRAGVPPHVEVAVKRGLAVDPDARFPDMTALLGALDAPRVQPEPRRGKLVFAVAAVAVLGGGAAWWIGRSDPEVAPVVDAGLVVGPQVIAEPLPNDRLKVISYRLSNGLTVWISPNRKSPRIEARLVIRVGSRDANGVGGLAHIVEHMTSAGTSRIGTLDFAKEKVHLDKLRTLYAAHATATGADKVRLIGEIDAESVAASRYAIPWELQDTHSILGIQPTAKFTWFDSTQFGVDIPSNKFPLWAKLEGERVADPVFRGFHVESGVVFDEIHTRRSQGALETMFDEMFANVFAGHPYALSPSGIYADLIVEPFTAAEQFHATWYVPNNAVLLLAGDVDDPEQAIRVLERELSRWKSKPLPRRDPRPLPPLTGEQRRTVKGMERPLVAVAWQSVPLGHADEDALAVLGQLIDHLAKGYAGRARIQITTDYRMIEASLFAALVVPTAGRTVDDGIADIDELIKTVQTGAFSDEVLTGVLRNYRLALDRVPESNAARIERMATAVLDDHGWAHELDRGKRVSALTKQDVLRVATRYLTRNRVVEVSEVGPYKMPAVERPKITPLQPKENARSAFVAQVLAEEVVDIPPRFVNVGRDYRVGDTPVGPVISVPNIEDETYVLIMGWELGSRQLPLVCAAIHALDHAGTGDSDATTRRTRWFVRAQTAEKLCTSEQILFQLTGVDSTFDADWADFERWISGSGIDDAVWARAARELLEFRRYSRAAPVTAALDEYASYGKASTFLVGATDADIQRATASEIRQTLQNLVGMKRVVSYYGPRSHDALRLPASTPARAAPVRPPRRLLRQTGTRIVLLDTGPNRAVTATIRIALGPLDGEQKAAAEVFASYLSNPVLTKTFNDQRGITFSGSAIVEERPLGDDASLQIRFSTTAEHLPAAIELVLASARDPKVDATYAAQARRRNEETFRADWLAPNEIPYKVLTWRTRGYQADPRSALFDGTLRVTERELSKLASTLVRAPTYISISGDVSALDRARLGKLGSLETATPATVFPP